MKKILTAFLLLISSYTFAQSGVDSALYYKNNVPSYNTPMAAKQYGFKYIVVDSGLSVMKKAFFYDSAFFKGRTYTNILPDPHDSSSQVPNTKWVLKELGRVGITDTTGKWVYQIQKNAAADSIIYYRGGIRYAIKDSIGQGSFKRSTFDFPIHEFVVTTLAADSFRVEFDTSVTSRIYTRHQIDSLLAGISGGSGWSKTGDDISSGQFLGTTNSQPLKFKYNNVYSALIDATNTSFGYGSFSSLTSGVGNLALGASALASTTTHQGNIGIGNSTLAAADADYNTVVGQFAAYALSSGHDNTILGYGALPTISVTGSFNTLLGTNTDLATAATKYGIGLGNLAKPTSYQLYVSDSIIKLKLRGLAGLSAGLYALVDTSGNGDYRPKRIFVPNDSSTILQTQYASPFIYNSAHNAIMTKGAGNAIDSLSPHAFASGNGSTITNSPSSNSFGEIGLNEDAEASTVLYGYNGSNIRSTDALAGGTGSENIDGSGGIAVGVGAKNYKPSGAAVGGNSPVNDGVEGMAVNGGRNGFDSSFAAGPGNFTNAKYQAMLGGHNRTAVAQENTVDVPHLYAHEKIYADKGLKEYTATIDLSGSDYTIDRPGIYEIIVAGPNKIIWPNPTAFDGSFITIYNTDVGGDAGYDASNAPYTAGSSSQFVDIQSQAQQNIKSINGKWRGYQSF